MFFTPFITGLLPVLAATSTQIEALQHPSIFILGNDVSSLSAMGAALQTLGYAYIAPETLNSSLPQLSTHTFTKLPIDAASDQLVIQYPNTRFIAPISTRKGVDVGNSVERRPCDNSWLTHLAVWSRLPKSTSDIEPVETIETARNEQLQLSKSSLEKEGRWLEIALDEREIYRGEKWLRLCKFLDLGYSVVERLNLKDFPSSMGQERKVSGWGGNFGMWGVAVQGSGV